MNGPCTGHCGYTSKSAAQMCGHQCAHLEECPDTQTCWVMDYSCDSPPTVMAPHSQFMPFVGWSFVGVSIFAMFLYEWVRTAY